MKKIFSLLLTISLWQIMYGQGVGIGTTDPHAPLQFESQAAERKIVLFEGANNDHQFIGFGVNGYGALKYQTATITNDHVFQTALSDSSSLELMRITGYGNIGMGTFPSNRLDIHAGFPRTGDHPFNRPLYVTGDMFEDYGIEFRHSNATQGIGFGYNTIYATGSNDDQPLQFASRGYASLIFKTQGFERMIISPEGNVGIGTYPTAPLHLSNSIQNRKIVLWDDSFNDYQFFGLGISGGTFRYNVANTGDSHVFYAGTSPSSADELMRIKGDGQVGIGVTAPLNKLDINFGPARAGSHPTGLAAYITGDLLPAGNGMEIKLFNSAQGIGIGYNTIYAAGTNFSQDLNIAAKGSLGTVFLKTNELNRVAVTGSGNVGIGTDTPHGKLQFAQGAANRKIVLAETVDDDHQFLGFGVDPTNSIRYQVSSSTLSHIFYAGTSGTTSKELMRIMGSGNVGINVSSALNRLDINGTTIRVGTHPTGLAAYITGNFGEASNGVEFRHFDGAEGIGFGSNTIYAAGSNTSQDLKLAAKGATGNISLSTNGSEKLKISGTAVSVTGWGEFKTANGEKGLGIIGNEFYAQGSLASVPLIFYGKGPTGDLQFITNGSLRMRITGEGNVGINIQNALNRLDLNNGAATRTGTHGTSLAMYVTGDFGASSNGVEFRHNDGTQGIGFGSNTIYAAGSNTNQDLNLAAKGATGNVSISTSGTERLKINGSGNIGLGVVSPQNKLDIHNGTARTNTHNSGNALYVTGGGEFRSADATTGLVIGSNNITASGSNASVDLTLAAKGASGNIMFNTNGAEKVRITAAGKVGIGTNAPNAPLQFSNTSENRKVVLYEGTNNDHQFIGLGHNTTSLRYQVNATTSDHIFYAATNTTTSSELMRIEGTGDVGIGTITPANRMDIAGAARTLTHPTGRPLYVTGALGSNSNGVEFRVNDATQGIGFGSNTIYAAGSAADHNLGMEAKGTGYVRFSTGGAERVRINSTGKVGIGTTTPNGALQFGQSLENRKIVLWEAANDDHQYFGFGVNGDGTLRYQTAHVANDHVFYSAASSSTDNEVLRIKGDGRVGIGNSTPNAALQFSNAVTTKKVVLHETAVNAHQFSGFGVGGDGSMTYQVPVENAEHIFSTGAGTSASLELMKIGNINGLTIQTAVTMSSNLTTNGNVTVGGNATVGGTMTVNGEIYAEPFNAADLTVTNNFTNYGNGYATAAFFKDKMGMVHLRGLVNRGSSHNLLIIFTLPPGYRPSTSGKLLYTTQSGSGISRIDILPDGGVQVMAGSTGWISLDGICFRAD